MTVTTTIRQPQATRPLVLVAASRAAGVYTVWEGPSTPLCRHERTGDDGRGPGASSGGRIVKGLWTRLNGHAFDRRSGDQACVYIGWPLCSARASPWWVSASFRAS